MTRTIRRSPQPPDFRRRDPASPSGGSRRSRATGPDPRRRVSHPALRPMSALHPAIQPPFLRDPRAPCRRPTGCPPDRSEAGDRPHRPIRLLRMPPTARQPRPSLTRAVARTGGTEPLQTWSGPAGLSAAIPSRRWLQRRVPAPDGFAFLRSSSSEVPATRNSRQTSSGRRSPTAKTVRQGIV